METFTCPNKCCKIKINPYTTISTDHDNDRSHRNKAGVFIYDPIACKVLLVQSRGHLWGSPKGTMKYNETYRQCAIREVKEETGLDITDCDFLYNTVLYHNAVYFYLEIPECEVTPQEHILGNDANAVGWIKPDCLEQCISNGNIILSQHCRSIFEIFLKRVFNHPEFIVVTKRKRYIF